VIAPLEDLLPEGGLRPGSVVAVGGASGSTSLVLGLLAGPLSGGAWGAVVGMGCLGLEAAAGAGVNLEHLALVPRWRSSWLEVVATLLGGFEVVALWPPGGCRGADARKLAARARQGGSVLVVAGPARAWPEPVDIELVVTATTWHGLEPGHGALAYRTLDVRSSGRRAAGRERRAQLLLPAPGGGLLAASPGVWAEGRSAVG
jgi:hypothetical protein